MEPYSPPSQILTAYSSVLVNFALGGGVGIKKGEVVYVEFETPALPLALEIYKAVLHAGGMPMVSMHAPEFQKVFYEHAQDSQLTFFPEAYKKSLVDTIDHRVYLIAPKDPLYLKDIDPAKIMKANQAKRKMRKWLFAKEDRGEFTWTIALYGTEGAAKEAGLSIQEYWEQIIRACYLDTENPIQVWKDTYVKLEKIRSALNAMPIKSFQVQSRETDLTILYGEKRKFMGGSGRNIPSFELFTSPDWRGTEGTISFDQPLYRYGSLITDISLTFQQGKVIKATASKNEHLLKELIKQENADKIGEFSLTDKRFSRIDKFMADTLFDENFGGKWGNTHVALGTSYHDCFAGDPAKLTEKDWEELGYNESPEHCDIIATADRTVTATMQDGSKKVIYAKGEFLV